MFGRFSPCKITRVWTHLGQVKCVQTWVSSWEVEWTLGDARCLGLLPPGSEPHVTLVIWCPSGSGPVNFSKKLAATVGVQNHEPFPVIHTRCYSEGWWRHFGFLLGQAQIPPSGTRLPSTVLDDAPPIFHTLPSPLGRTVSLARTLAFPQPSPSSPQ